MPFPRRRLSLSPHPRHAQNTPATARTTSLVPFLRWLIPRTGAYLGVYFFARAALRVGYLREGRYCCCSLVNLFRHCARHPPHILLLGNADSSRVPQDWPLLLDSIITRKMGEGTVLPASACTPWSFISSLSFSYSTSLRSPRSRCQDDTPPNRR
ncbi:hypothetical protein C8F01DRAFT_1179257 [Mycena amicta]|nr:hypothetical protein C8F01DRAFT_1179257 [Mycena amicta]